MGVLCQSGVSGGSSNVRNMTCARDGECVGDNVHKEHFNLSLSRARQKNCACECVRGEVCCLHFLAVVFTLSSDLVLAFALAFVLLSFPLARAGLAFAFVVRARPATCLGCFASIRFSFDSPSPCARKLHTMSSFLGTFDLGCPSPTNPSAQAACFIMLIQCFRTLSQISSILSCQHC